MKEKSTIQLAIGNLETMSLALENAANNPKNYNTEFAAYLDNWAAKIREDAIFLKEKEYLFGDFYG